MLQSTGFPGLLSTLLRDLYSKPPKPQRGEHHKRHLCLHLIHTITLVYKPKVKNVFIKILQNNNENDDDIEFVEFYYTGCRRFTRLSKQAN